MKKETIAELMASPEFQEEKAKAKQFLQDQLHKRLVMFDGVPRALAQRYAREAVAEIVDEQWGNALFAAGDIFANPTTAFASLMVSADGIAKKIMGRVQERHDAMDRGPHG